jgi:hypothetical protein
MCEVLKLKHRKILKHFLFYVKFERGRFFVFEIRVAELTRR